MSPEEHIQAYQRLLEKRADEIALLKSTLEACNTVAADYKKVRDEYKTLLDAIRECGDPECRLCEACGEGLP